MLKINPVSGEEYAIEDEWLVWRQRRAVNAIRSDVLKRRYSAPASHTTHSIINQPFPYRSGNRRIGFKRQGQ